MVRPVVNDGPREAEIRRLVRAVRRGSRGGMVPYYYEISVSWRMVSCQSAERDRAACPHLSL